jgi:hypothetical protein
MNILQLALSAICLAAAGVVDAVKVGDKVSRHFSWWN